MKIRILCIAALICGQVYGYKLHVINNTSRLFKLRANYMTPREGGLWLGNKKDVFLQPYSVNHFSAANDYWEHKNHKFTELKIPYSAPKDPESMFCWVSINADFTYKDDSFNLMKHKSGCSDIYAIIEVDDKGNFTITRWSGAGTKYKHFYRYLKKHKDQMLRKAAEMKNAQGA